MNTVISRSGARFLCCFLAFWLIFNSLLVTSVYADNEEESEQDIKSLVTQGLDAYHSNQFKDAITYLESAIHKLSEKAENREKLSDAYLYLGKCFIIDNDVPKAREAFRKALEFNPGLTLDPSQDSPKILTPFNEVRVEFLQERAEQEKTEQVVTSPILDDFETTEKPKKKWYKKWWVWTLGAVVVGGAAVAAGGSSGGSDDGKATIQVRWYP
ncbi:tetratricopeptide repeat protein [candidate division CSSED10-310 bacterium]|uniref:Tetratricopeptide repeat protein n=1 Tax=candidate division CSSED10-310 bacterium TaxID=2855610 RepID=A0ABV6Z6A9_UNCC1